MSEQAPASSHTALVAELERQGALIAALRDEVAELSTLLGEMRARVEELTEMAAIRLDAAVLDEVAGMLGVHPVDL